MIERPDDRSLVMLCCDCLIRFDLDDVLEDGTTLAPGTDVPCPTCGSIDTEIAY